MKKIWIMLLLCAACCETMSQTGTTTSVTLKIAEFCDDFKNNLGMGDTLRIELYREMQKAKPLINEIIEGKWDMATNEYYFEIKDLQGVWYFNISNKSKPNNWGVPTLLMEHWNIEPGDHVKITCKAQPNIFGNYIKGEYFRPYSKWFMLGMYHARFSGKGALKYQIKYQVDSVALTQTPLDLTLMDSTGELNKNYFTQKSIHRGVQILERYKKQLGERNYYLLKMNIIAGMNDTWIEQYHYSIYFNIKLKERNFRKSYNEHVNLFETEIRHIPEYAIQNSLWYHNYISRRYRIFKESARALNEEDFTFTNNYQVLNSVVEEYKSPLKEKILMDYVASDVRSIRGDTRFLVHVMAAFNSDNYKQRLLSYLSIHMPGSEAYNFSLSDTSGKMVSLSDFKGKVVFIDFWFTGCGGCSAYFKAVVDPVEKHYRDSSNVVFITVSTDYHRDKWVKGIETGLYTSDKAINLYTNGLGGAHKMITEYGITSYPSPLLVDKEGKIFSTNVEELRIWGPRGLISTIDRALKQN